MSDEFITTEDFINANRSPPLQPTQPNYRSIDTPPPLVDIDHHQDSDTADAHGEGDHDLRSQFKSGTKQGRPQPSLCDSVLIRFLGPDYPDVASKAGKEFFTWSPEATTEDHRPSVATAGTSMLSEAFRLGVSGTAEEARVLARAAFEASEKLNAAIHKDGRGPYATAILQPTSNKQGTTIVVHEIDPEPIMSTPDSMHRRSIEHRYSNLHSLSDVSSHKGLNVKPPPKVSLPAIRTKSPASRSEWVVTSSDSIATSPALAKFTITPANGSSQQQLPRMQTSPSTSLPGQIPSLKQTLPSLETALSQIPEADSIPYTGPSSTLSKSSPGPYHHFGGPPSSTYSGASPASAISPPRIPSHPSYWRTSGPETTNSTPSDQMSTGPSAGISTPTSSYFGHSPANSVNTPATIMPDVESRHMADNLSAVSSTSSQVTDGSAQFNGNYGGGSFKCTFPGCTAPPFQTQYLLNSHANVHSNTRPHFCPVQGCPRGPGGQGFKRKNEMIRHGLVHQSPGYVCPFCPDQQHKYPRPDNLQRHVRVHHVDKDRDDPMLRDVLAQRPEGGNRGRRRRLGS